MPSRSAGRCASSDDGGADGVSKHAATNAAAAKGMIKRRINMSSGEIPAESRRRRTGGEGELRRELRRNGDCYLSTLARGEPPPSWPALSAAALAVARCAESPVAH